MSIQKLLPVFLLALLVLQPLSGQSTVGDPALAKQIVGTVAGDRFSSGDGDEAADAHIVSLMDFVFTPDGEMLVVSSYLHQIFRIAPDGAIRVFAGAGEPGHAGDGGPKEEALFDSPRALAIGADGSVYVAENAYLRKISPQGIVSTIAGNGETSCLAPGSAPLQNRAGGINRMSAGRDGALYILSCQGVYKLEGNLVTELLQEGGTKDQAIRIGSLEVPASSWRRGTVTDIATRKNGDLVIADDRLGEIYALTPQGTIKRIAGAFGNPLYARPPLAEAKLSYLVGIQTMSVHESGSIYVLPYRGEPYLAVIEPDGSFQLLSDTAMDYLVDGASVPYHSYLAFDSLRPGPDDSLYARLHNGQIFRYAGAGALHHVAFRATVQSGEATPAAELDRSLMNRVLADATGNLFVITAHWASLSHRVYKISPDGEVTHYAGSGGDGVSDDSGPAREAVISALWAGMGPQGDLYYRGSTDPILRRVGADGMIHNVLGGGAELPGIDLTGKRATDINFLGEPSSVNPPDFYISASGEIYFQRRSPPGMDPFHLIWKVNQDGLIEHVAGGLSPRPPDIEGANVREIVLPFFSFFRADPAGTFYFGYQAQGEAALRIYRVDEQGIIRRFAGNGQWGPVEAGKLQTETSVGACPSPDFVTPGELRCIAGFQGAVYHMREGEPVTLVLQNGNIYGNDGGFLGDDSSAAGLTSMWFSDGAVFGRQISPSLLSIRRTWVAPEGCSYQVNTSAITVPDTGAETAVTLTTGANCPWAAGTSSYWLSIDGPTYGQGSTTISLRAKANPSVESRETVLSIVGNRVTVAQQASTAPPLFVTPLAITIPAEGGEAAFSVTAAEDKLWQAAVSGDWLELVSPGAGSGSGAIRVHAPANSTGALRIAKIIVNGREAVVRQPAVAGTGGGDAPKLDAVVEGAGFRNIPLAPGSIASLFGERLAPGIAAAEELPLPTTLQGVQLRFRAGSYERQAAFFYVSPSQINFLMPADAPEGPAELELLHGGEEVGAIAISVAAVAPSLFSANSNGEGAPAGYATAVAEDGTQTHGNLFTCPEGSPCEPAEVDYGEPGTEVFLVLFGTGFRGLADLPEVRLGGVSAEVIYAGPQGFFEGLDQINIHVPEAVRGLGVLNVEIVHGGVAANTLQVKF